MAKGEKKQSGKNPSGKNKEPEIRMVSENRKARFRFEILDSLECGIQLTGSEVAEATNPERSPLLGAMLLR